MKTADIDRAVDFMQTLTAHVRLELLMFLRGTGRATPTDMLRALAHRHLSPTNLSEHLRFLSKKRLVKVKKSGRNVFYEIDRARARAEIARLKTLARIIGSGRLGGRP